MSKEQSTIEFITIDTANTTPEPVQLDDLALALVGGGEMVVQF